MGDSGNLLRNLEEMTIELRFQSAKEKKLTGNLKFENSMSN